MQPGCISLIAVFENLISPWAAFEPSLFCPPRKPAFNNSFLSFSFEHGDVGRVFFFFLIHFEPGPTRWLYSVSGLSLIGSCISKWSDYSSRGCLFCLTWFGVTLGEVCRLVCSQPWACKHVGALNVHALCIQDGRLLIMRRGQAYNF